MGKKIGKYGIGYKSPSYHNVGEELLKELVDKTNLIFQEFKDESKRMSCTIMSNETFWGIVIKGLFLFIHWIS